MSVFGRDIPDSVIKKMKAFYKQFLDGHVDLKAVVTAKTKGLTGQKRNIAFKRAIRGLLKKNSVFRNAADAKIKELRGL